MTASHLEDGGGANSQNIMHIKCNLDQMSQTQIYAGQTDKFEVYGRPHDILSDQDPYFV
jgi:hypothetical protein